MIDDYTDLSSYNLEVINNAYYTGNSAICYQWGRMCVVKYTITVISPAVSAFVATFNKLKFKYCTVLTSVGAYAQNNASTSDVFCQLSGDYLAFAFGVANQQYQGTAISIRQY